MSTSYRFTVTDLDLTPDDGGRYEVIDGDLQVSKQPDLQHQYTSDRFVIALDTWGEPTRAGLVVSAPGLIFAQDEAVAPDVVWISRARMTRVVGADGKLHAAPDLIVEILSEGPRNEDRDRELKLKLYSRYGVLEYWIVDWREPAIQVYRRHEGALQLVGTLRARDTLTSPSLPGFARPVADLCAPAV